MGYSIDDYYQDHVLPKLRQAAIFDPDSDEEPLDKFKKVLEDLAIDADEEVGRGRGNDLIVLILRTLLPYGQLDEKMEQVFNLLTEDMDLEIRSLAYRNRNSNVAVLYNQDKED